MLRLTQLLTSHQHLVMLHKTRRRLVNNRRDTNVKEGKR